MLAKTGLLIVSNPKQIGKILSSVQKQVKHTLYIQLLSALGEPFGNFCPKVFNTWPKFSRTIFNIYSQAATYCYDLDVKVLLSGIKYNIPKIQTQKCIDLVIFDKLYNQSDIDQFIKSRIQNVTKECKILTLNTDEVNLTVENSGNEDTRVYKHTVLGGTFDRLHLAHKLLLSEAALRSNEKVTVGVTEENMLCGKTLWELIENIDIRIGNVTNFLKDICLELNYDIVPISDPFGPAIIDPAMELIVVSQETLKGGVKINEIRQEKNLKPLEILNVELVDEPNPKPIEETKISSSTTRIRLLGTLLKPVKPNNDLPKVPYVIGLTGGIASGKSGVAKYLEELGALIINCDTVAYDVYKPGKPCYKSIIEHFGKSVLAENGEINRQALGGMVFKNPAQLEVLNSIVWPATAQEVISIVTNTPKKIVVIEAALLLSAGWEKYCHEVWTTIISKEEAIARQIKRNLLTEEQAKLRITAQPPNSFYVKSANVVFCTLWPAEYTKEQVFKAWGLLQERLANL